MYGAADLITMSKDGSQQVNYKIGVLKAIKLGGAIIEKNLLFLSSSDSMCFFKSLMQLAGYQKDDPDAFKDAYLAALVKSHAIHKKDPTKDQNIRGHTVAVCLHVCATLGIGISEVGDFVRHYNDNGDEMCDEYPLLPRILVIARSHAGVVVYQKLRGKRYITIRDIANAFTFNDDELITHVERKKAGKNRQSTVN